MPIPLILGAAAAAKVAHDMSESNRLDERASEKTLKALNTKIDAEFEAKQAKIRADEAIKKLAQRKRAILSTSMKNFLEVFQTIKRINFVEGDGIKELDFFSPSIIEETKLAVDTSLKTTSNTEAIATLALMGATAGTAIIIGANPLIATAVLSHSIKKDSEANYAQARAFMKMADVATSQAETMVVVCDGVIKRANSIAQVLSKLNLLFLKSIKNISEIIEKNGEDKRAYSPKEREELATCVNIASTIKKILDTPLLDQKGKIAMESLEAVQTGENFIRELNSI
ncbi:MAG TPA: hypothetical protein DIT54_10505 [Lachnospiraceae bacterium]|nr:hypothetical protein [Lachnospiraceae bacterium]HIS62921.1 hypothetical protein [Candidatus Scybalomonas excrementigallinarum]